MVFKHVAKLHKEPIRLRYINTNCANDTLNAAKKDDSSYFQRHNATNRFYQDNEGSLLRFMCFILRHSVLLNLSKE